MILANCSNQTHEAINKWESGKTIPANNWRRENPRVMTRQVLQKRLFIYQRVGLKLLGKTDEALEYFCKKQGSCLCMYCEIQTKSGDYALPLHKFVRKQLCWEKNQHSTNWILNEVFFAGNSMQNESDPVPPFILFWNLIWSLELAGGIMWLLFCLKRKNP